MTGQPEQGDISESVCFLSVHYLIRVPIAEAEGIVGRPWIHEDAEDDSWECEMEENAKDHLPGLLEYADEPEVECK